MEHVSSKDTECQSIFLKSISAVFKEPLEESLQLLESDSIESHKDKLKHQLAKLSRNVDNLMLLSSVRQDALVRETTKVESIAFFESIAYAYAEIALEKEIDYYVFIDPAIPKFIEIDTKYLGHILHTLLENGVKHTKAQGSVYFEVRAKPITKEQVELTYTVSDTGKGIAKEAIKEILQPFATQSSEGLGVALASVYHLLKGLGAPLKVASQEGKGSRFSFSMEHKAYEEPSFEIFADIKVGVFVEARELFGYAKVLYQYLIAMGLSVSSIKGSDDPATKECQLLFVVTNKIDSFESINDNDEHLHVVPAIIYTKNHAFMEKFPNVQKLLLPGSVHYIAKFIEGAQKDMPQEVLQANAEDQLAIQHLAEEAEKEKIRILVVEDNPINLKLVKVILGRYDFDIDTAENGQIAVDLCKESKYNLVLMDIDMPVMDGITATNTIKNYEKEEGIEPTPIVALTSHDLVGEREEIMAKGLDEHMPKPLNVGRLELMLERYIGYKHD